jgi:hypothetical protein
MIRHFGGWGKCPCCRVSYAFDVPLPHLLGGDTTVPLFSRRKALDVQGLMLNVLNNSSEELGMMIEGPRLDGRVRLTLVVQVVPVEQGRPQVNQAFAAVTKEFSSMGVSLVVNEPFGLDEVVVGFRWEQSIRFVRGRAIHLSPMGAGFFQLGIQLKEVVPAGDYPELQKLHF